ncbi:hypothetical protein HDU78_003657, partial [Chytriomyces hyalinus]
MMVAKKPVQKTLSMLLPAEEQRCPLRFISTSDAAANGASARRDSGAGLLANAVSGLAASPNLPGFLGSDILDFDFTKLIRKRMVSVHPSGFATLHHLDVGSYVQGRDHSSNASVGSYGNSPG